jgi:hypothetical protein
MTVETYLRPPRELDAFFNIGSGFGIDFVGESKKLLCSIKVGRNFDGLSISIITDNQAVLQERVLPTRRSALPQKSVVMIPRQNYQ